MNEENNAPDTLHIHENIDNAIKIADQLELTSDSDQTFVKLEEKSTSNQSSDISLIMDIPVRLSVEFGRTKMTIKKLLSLSQGSVVALDGFAGEALDILINGYLIARGEVVVISKNYGIRITDIITPSERMSHLSR